MTNHNELFMNKIRQHTIDYIKGYDSDDIKLQTLREEAMNFFESELFVEISPFGIDRDAFIDALDYSIKTEGKTVLLERLNKQIQKIGA